MDLPFVVRQAGRRWHRPIARRRLEPAGEAARVVPMIVDQIGYGFAAMLLGQIVLGAMVLLDVVVLDVRLRTVEMRPPPALVFPGLLRRDRQVVGYTYTLVCRDSVYRPFVDDLRTTKQPSLSPCFSSDSARCRDISPTYHLDEYTNGFG